MTKQNLKLICIDDEGANGEFYSLDRSIWAEYRKIQGENIGKPFTVQTNGIIQLSRLLAGAEVRVYVKRSDIQKIQGEI